MIVNNSTKNETKKFGFEKPVVLDPVKLFGKIKYLGSQK
jgi:hypothetical protein